MKALYLSLWCALAGAALGCVGDLPDELPYGCETADDCGGDGYVCTVLPDARRYCCLPADETCNGVDDDCDGVVDDVSSGPCNR
ncbi:hypothetical protein [Hyalangium gracile]|uniref:hypothetical protein n=1 Tax=Hyalangium gracile TaxID=394092 RepID=UPI001CCE5D97|nr:hypothetical protein [Hyalangium gracile]